jgi:transposase-like protein
MSGFRWTKQTIQAARLVADGRLTEVEIAVEIGISDRQLRRWKHIPEFQSDVRKQQEDFRELLLAYSRRKISDQWMKEIIDS